MIVFLTNIPSPYRTAFFNKLNEEAKKNNLGLHVIYCAKTEPRRFWDFDPIDQKYEYTFLNGIHPNFNGFYPHINFGVIKIIKNINPRFLILAGSWNTPTMLYTLLNKSKFNAKMLFWSEGHSDAQKIDNKFYNILRKSVFKKFDAYVVPNFKSKNYILNLINDSSAKIGFLPNTIDELFFDEKKTESKSFLRNKFNINNDSICLVCISTLSIRKGVIELINAYSLLSKHNRSKLSIVFAGTGDQYEKLIQIKKINNLTNIKILGHVDKLAVRELLKLSDLFILPTKLDPNPLTPIEASFMKTPLVLSKYAGNFSDLINPKTGFEINDVSSTSICKVLNVILTINKNELIKMGENAFENVKTKFSRMSSSKNLIDFLLNL